MRNLCARVRGPRSFVESISYCPTSFSYTSRLVQLPSSISDFIEPFLIFILSFRPPSRRSSLRLVLFRPLIFFPLICHIAFRSALVFPSPIPPFLISFLSRSYPYSPVFYCTISFTRNTQFPVHVALAHISFASFNFYICLK